MASATCLMAARAFLEVFPEAKAFSITIMTKDKDKTLINRPHCAKETLLKELPNWLGYQEHHFFIRPLLASLVMLDLDKYGGDIETLVRLKPRALVEIYSCRRGAPVEGQGGGQPPKGPGK